MVVTNLNLKWLSNNPYFPFDKLGDLWFVIFVKGNYHYDVKLLSLLLYFMFPHFTTEGDIIHYLISKACGGNFGIVFWTGKMHSVSHKQDFGERARMWR